MIEQFAHQLHAGHFRSTGQTLEDLSYLSNSDLESVSTRYAHGDCLYWALALLNANVDLQAQMIVSDDDQVIHIFVTDQLEHVTFDANGFSTIDQQLSYWQDMSNSNDLGDVNLEVVNVEELSQMFNFEQTEVDDAFHNIAYWLNQAKDYISNHTNDSKMVVRKI